MKVIQIGDLEGWGYCQRESFPTFTERPKVTGARRHQKTAIYKMKPLQPNKLKTSHDTFDILNQAHTASTKPAKPQL